MNDADPKALLPPFIPVFTLPPWATYLGNIAPLLPSLVAPPNGKRLLAMGDSWFNYLPHYDVIWWLRAKYGFACDSMAVIGEKLVQMAPPKGWDPFNPPTDLKIGDPGHQLAALALAMRALSGGQKDEVSAVLISGGGNDIAGDGHVVGSGNVLRQLLNDAAAGPPHINAAAFEKIVRQDMYALLRDILTQTIRLIDIYLPNRKIPIYIHGYAWPVPDGRPGPINNWLKPAFDDADYTSLQLCTDIMQDLINRFRQLILDVIAEVTLPGTPQRAFYLDVRGALSNSLAGGAYKADWQNELHPSIPAGFEKVADLFAHAIGVPATANSRVEGTMEAA